MLLIVRFGANVRRLRNRLGISQDELARRVAPKVKTQIKNSNISTLEVRDTRVPRPSTVRRFAIALECQPDELLFGVVTEYDRFRWPALSEDQREALVAGFGLMSAGQRKVLLDQLASKVAALPRAASASQDRESTPATVARDRKTPQRNHG